ncbi:MAG: hypothetical protein JWQ71_3669 [Pedosphaera sp.]|nr:hypothetical protein [Pedosphaera sp.]
MMRLMGVQTAIIETIPSSSAAHDRFRQEEKAILTRLQNPAVRVSFQKITFTSKKVKDLVSIQKLCDEDFLGLAVIANIEFPGVGVRTYVFESVVREVGIQPSKENAEIIGKLPWVAYLHVKRKFKCSVSHRKKPYEILGTFFCQQNTITTVCAHACTAMMLNNCRDSNVLVTCEDINQLLGIDHKNRMQEVPELFGDNSCATHEGLYPKEISRVLREYGFRPYQLDFSGSKRRFYREFIYSFIESGFPALLSFNSLNNEGEEAAHVVAVVGHSLNRHSWFPTGYASYAKQIRKEKPFISSLNWVDDFIVHDDNFGMQLCLPAHSFRPEDYPDPGPAFTPFSALGIFPEASNIKLSGTQAEIFAWDALIAMFESSEWEKSGICDNYYVDHLRPRITGEKGTSRTAVIRTSQLPAEHYLEHLKQPDNYGNVYNDKDIELIRASIGKQTNIWLSEVTESDLYVGNQAKVIDIVINPQFDQNAEDPKLPILLIRLPHFLVFMDSEGEDYRFKIREIKGIKGHMPLSELPTEIKVTSLL